MTAKEMFNKLGYVREELDNLKVIRYTYSTKELVRTITFWLVFREFSTSEIDRESDTFNGAFIGSKLLDAINKQCKELGWKENEQV